MKSPKKPKKIVINAKAEREASGLNQHDFWAKYGVTQSGGSRYESGRTIPKPVRMLMAIDLGAAPVSELTVTGELADRV